MDRDLDRDLLRGRPPLSPGGPAAPIGHLTAGPVEDPDAIRAALAAGWVRRVLVLRVARVGDTLHVLPALDLLRQALRPGTFVAFVCSDYAHPVARGAPVDLVVPYPHKGRGPDAVLGRRRAVRALEAAGPFDLCIGLEDKPWGRRLARRLGCRLWHADTAGGVHVVERKAGVLTPLGLWSPADGPPPPIRWTPRARRRALRSAADPAADLAADLFASLPRPLIGLQVGSHARRFLFEPRRRRDPTAAWVADVAAALHTGLGATPVIHAGGGGLEARVARAVARALDARGVPHATLAGLDLDGLGAALASLDAFVSANTGPAHLAAAVGTPVVLLDGPAPRDVAPPWRAEHLHRLDLRLDCSPCRGTSHGRRCRVPRCLDEIQPAAVTAAVRALLGSRRQGGDRSRGIDGPSAR